MAQTNNNFNESINLELSIQLSLSGLSFCILNRNLNTIIFLEEHYFKKKLNPLEVLDYLKEVFHSKDILTNTFSKVLIIHENDLSTLVPLSLFNENYLADYLKFNSKILKSDYITFDNILENKSVNVYVPYININNFIYDKFGAFTFKHSSTILIEKILQLEKDQNNTKVYVNVSKDHFEIVVIEHSKLKLFNTFNFQTKEDFIYYILFTAEQLNLDPEILNLIFLGDISSKDDLFVIAHKYIRFVFLGNREDDYKYNISAQPKSNHSNFTLINSF